MRGKIPVNLIFFILTSFAIMSLFGVGVSMEMKDGQMSDCPFTANTASMCQMSAVEHVGEWFKAITGKPAKTNWLLDLLLLSAISVFLVKIFSSDYIKELTSRAKSYIRTFAVKIFAPLLLAFSDGILHPKIYPATIIN